MVAISKNAEARRSSVVFSLGEGKACPEPVLNTTVMQSLLKDETVTEIRTWSYSSVLKHNRDYEKNTVNYFPVTLLRTSNGSGTQQRSE